MRMKENQIKIYKSQCKILTISIKIGKPEEKHNVHCGLCCRALEILSKMFCHHFIDQDNNFGIEFEDLKTCWKMYESEVEAALPQKKKNAKDPLEYTDKDVVEVKEENSLDECEESANEEIMQSEHEAVHHNDEDEDKDCFFNVKEELADELMEKVEELRGSSLEEDKEEYDLSYLSSENKGIGQYDKNDGSNQQESDQVEDHKQADRSLTYKRRADGCKSAAKRRQETDEILDAIDKEEMQKKRIKNSIKALTKDKSGLPLDNLTHEQNLQFIKLYENTPCLWQVDNKEFRFKNPRKKALDEMLQLVQTQIDCGYSIDELKKSLLRLNSACREEKRRKLECKRLQLEYKPICKYYNDIAFLESNVAPFCCELCNDSELFTRPDIYLKHKSTHDESTPYKCSICNKDFTNSKCYAQHMNVHEKGYRFECEVCNKRFAYKSSKETHVRIHTGEKPYFCEFCGAKFRARAPFNRHRYRHLGRANYECKICQKVFYDSSSLKDHMDVHLNVRDKKCDECGKTYTTSKYLRQHKQIHAKEKKYVCKICHKDFAQAAGLHGHMRSHGSKLT